MIKLDDFNEISAGTRGGSKKTYIWISGTNCTLNFSRELSRDAEKYFGGSVCVRANNDFTKFIILRGNDRRVKDNKTVIMNAIRDDLRAKFGDNIHYLYFNGRWEETDNGIKVYLLELCGKDYAADATIRSVKKA